MDATQSVSVSELRLSLAAVLDRVERGQRDVGDPLAAGVFAGSPTRSLLYTPHTPPDARSIAWDDAIEAIIRRARIVG